MSEIIRELINKRDRLLQLIYSLEDENQDKYEDLEFIRNEQTRETIFDLIYENEKKIASAYMLLCEIDQQTKLTYPPIKTGEFVDLRTNGKQTEYFIFLHDQPVEVGSIQYRTYHADERLGDVGYHINYEYRDNGYATEALSLLSEKLYEDKVPDMWITVKDSNHKSIRVIEKNGGNILNKNKGVILYKVPTKSRKLDTNVNYGTR